MPFRLGDPVTDHHGDPLAGPQGDPHTPPELLSQNITEIGGAAIPQWTPPEDHHGEPLAVHHGEPHTPPELIRLAGIPSPVTPPEAVQRAFEKGLIPGPRTPPLIAGHPADPLGAPLTPPGAARGHSRLICSSEPLHPEVLRSHIPQTPPRRKAPVGCDPYEGRCGPCEGYPDGYGPYGERLRPHIPQRNLERVSIYPAKAI